VNNGRSSNRVFALNLCIAKHRELAKVHVYHPSLELRFYRQPSSHPVLHVLSIAIMASKAIAIVAGVGPGTGAAVARKFAAAYPVVLLARNPANYESLVEEINKSGGKAMGISTDVSSPESLKAAFDKVKEEHKDAPIAAAIFNASGRFVRKPLLDMAVEDFIAGYDVGV